MLTQTRPLHRLLAVSVAFAFFGGLGFVRSANAAPDPAQAAVAAIEALGPNPRVERIGAIIHDAITKNPKSAIAIVAATVKFARAEAAYEIVEEAIASLPHPEDMVGGLTMAEAIVKAALDARPGLDHKELNRAANRGLRRNPFYRLPGSPKLEEEFERIRNFLNLPRLPEGSQ